MSYVFIELPVSRFIMASAIWREHQNQRGAGRKGRKRRLIPSLPDAKETDEGSQVALAIKNLHCGSFDRNGLSQQAHKERKKKGIAKSLISK